MAPVVYYYFIRVSDANRTKTSTRWTTWAVQGMPKCSVRILSLEAAEAVAGSVGTREDVRFAHALTSSVLWRL